MASREAGGVTVGTGADWYSPEIQNMNLVHLVVRGLSKADNRYHVVRICDMSLQLQLDCPGIFHQCPFVHGHHIDNVTNPMVIICFNVTVGELVGLHSSSPVHFVKCASVIFLFRFHHGAAICGWLIVCNSLQNKGHPN